MLIEHHPNEGELTILNLLTYLLYKNNKTHFSSVASGNGKFLSHNLPKITDMKIAGE